MQAEGAASSAHPAGEAASRGGPLLGAWDRAEQIAIGSLAAYGLFAAMYQTVTRYAFPQASGEWSDETMVYALIWAVFLASSSLVRSDGHVRADMFLRMLGDRGRRRVEVFNTLVALAFTLLLTWYGVLIAWEGWLWDERSMTTVRFPMWVYFAAVPVGGGLMVLRYLRRLYLLLFTSGQLIRFDQHDPVNVD